METSMDLSRPRAFLLTWGLVVLGVGWALSGLGGGLFLLSGSSLPEPVPLVFMLCTAVAGAASGVAAVLAGLRRGAAGAVALAGLLVGVQFVFSGLLYATQGSTLVGLGILFILSGVAGIAAYAAFRSALPNAWMVAGALASVAGGLLVVAGLSSKFASSWFPLNGLALAAAGAALAMHGAAQRRLRPATVLGVALALALFAAAMMTQLFGALDGLFSYANSRSGLQVTARVFLDLGTLFSGVAGFAALAGGIVGVLMAAQPAAARPQGA